MNRHSLTKLTLFSAVLAGLGLARPCPAGEIVQSGSLSGAGAPMTQDVVLDRFDDQGGTLQLDAVIIEALTSIGGGYTTDGSGVSVDVDAVLRADYSLSGNLLVSTQAVIDLTVPNTGPPIAVSVFDNDTGSTTITGPAALAAWVGAGTITLQAFTSFTIMEVPAGVIFFGAGGTVQYTVTYQYSVGPAPDLFIRGDCNASGSVDLADGVALLAILFVPGTAPPDCDDACDANDDGMSDLADAIYLLNALFVPGAPVLPPPNQCDPDPTLNDPFGCATFTPCP